MLETSSANTPSAALASTKASMRRVASLKPCVPTLIAIAIIRIIAGPHASRNEDLDQRNPAWVRGLVSSVFHLKESLFTKLILVRSFATARAGLSIRTSIQRRRSRVPPSTSSTFFHLLEVASHGSQTHHVRPVARSSGHHTAYLSDLSPKYRRRHSVPKLTNRPPLQ